MIAEAAVHLAKLSGLKEGTLTDYWHQAELRILSVISNTDAQYDGNTKLHR